MSNICSIYGLFSTQEPDHIRYIGQTIRLIEQRKKAHIYEAKKMKKRRPVLDWINSVYKNGFKIGVVELNSKAKWNVSEKYYIKKFKNTGNNLLNLTDGGEGTIGWKPSQQWCKNVSKRNTGNVWSEERKLKRKEYLKENHPFTGRKHLEKSKKEMSNSKKGKVLPHMKEKKTEEQKRKIGEASKKRILENGHPMKGKHHSEKTKDKIRQSLFGKKHFIESRNKMSISRKGFIPWNKGVKFSYDGNGGVIRHG